MCGILGLIYGDKEINKENFVTLNEIQSHRGPDATGVWFSADGKIALGHTRLSIIDLDRGGQPMLNEKRNKVITYNGELYNFRELKKTLAEKGHKFKTDSDTEVIMKAYEQWGCRCIDKFQGMFAFAIVDSEKGEVFLVRDHFGIKPLVYYFDNKIFAFASEIRTLSSVKNFDLSLDFKAIDYYLRMQYIPAPFSVFAKIRKLEPAHFLRVDFYGNILEKKRYWRPEFRPDRSKSIDKIREELDYLLLKSVKRHTVADVPYGAFLSGGIDSTIIVKYLSKFANRKIKTFSIGFNEKEYNELEYSREASIKYGTEHHFETVDPDFFSVFDKLVLHYGEPFADSSAIPTYYVSKLASRHVKVVLSGDGGDELFGGYNSYRTWHDLPAKKHNRPAYLNFVRFWLSTIRPERFVPEKVNLSAWLNLVGYYSYPNRKYLWQRDYVDFIAKEYEPFAEFDKDFKRNTTVNKAQLFDLTNYLPFDILTKVDIASMMNGLEVRVPFIDKELVEFALTIPENVNYRDRRWEGKLLLKKNLAEDFSDNYIYRNKQGFAIPLDKWLAVSGELYCEPYLKLINSDSKIFKEIFNLDAVYNFIASGEASKIYFLLFLETWLAAYETHKAKIVL